jgi:ABC-type polysaccharide/polyol phosphate export permease
MTMGIMPVLAAVVDITGGEDGGHVMIDPLMPMLMSALYLFLIILPLLFILGIVFYKKKYQHLQILTAMEKGLPITDLIARPQIRNREVNWVRSLSTGIGFIFTGLALAGFFVWTNVAPGVTSVDSPFLILPIVIFGLGLIFLFRGILQKNYEKQKQKENTAPPQ